MDNERMSKLVTIKHSDSFYEMKTYSLTSKGREYCIRHDLLVIHP
jgi:hypothetical protein